MDKKVVIMGIATMIIGISFGIFGLIQGTNDQFYTSIGIWAVGAVALILGLTVLAKEEGFLAGRY